MIVNNNTGTTFPEGQFWKCTKAMAMKWSTQTSLTKFRSVFGNGSDLDSLGFSVSLHSNPYKKACSLISCSF